MWITTEIFKITQFTLKETRAQRELHFFLLTRSVQVSRLRTFHLSLPSLQSNVEPREENRSHQSNLQDVQEQKGCQRGMWSMYATDEGNYQESTWENNVQQLKLCTLKYLVFMWNKIQYAEIPSVKTHRISSWPSAYLTILVLLYLSQLHTAGSNGQNSKSVFLAGTRLRPE
jgi:hypothetical protein